MVVCCRLEQLQHPYPAWVTEQPYSGTALLSSHEQGERKGSLNKACSTLTLLVYRGQLSIQLRGRKTQRNQHKLRVASWNVRTLLDSPDRHERRSAIIGRELARYSIDIAALSETRISGESQFAEVGAGYTFFTVGHPEGKPRQAGVGFAIKSSLLPQLEEQPKGISPRLMTMKLRLNHGRSATLVSAYAPTMSASDHEKEAFYASLNSAINAVPYKHRLFVLGDFNARVGRDCTTWPRVLGHHSVGNENSNGSLLLQTCAQHELAITNTIFQQATKYKTTWMHPRSKHWHMLDYVITRQRDVCEVHLTRVMRGTDCWSDHRLVRCDVALNLCPPKRRCAHSRRKKLDVCKLKMPEVKTQLQCKLSESLSRDPELQTTIDEDWEDIKDTTYKQAAEVLGFKCGRHQDWFDEQDVEARTLLDVMHTTHLAWINDKSNSTKKSTYTKARQAVQSRLRAMKESWWASKALELQAAADQHNMKRFYDGLRTLYGSRDSGSTPVRSKDGSTLITDREKILHRWAEHFETVLNQPSLFDDTVLDEIPQVTESLYLDRPPNTEEVHRAIKQLSSGKSPGEDSIPPEIYKDGGSQLVDRLVGLFVKIWDKETVPQDFKDALIVHIFKRKGDRACCDDHRGISLLSIAGKVLARILLNRLSAHVLLQDLLPESQCGFRAGRGTADMIFTARQIQEKCREQHQDLYMVFIDLTKAFDTVNREGLWKILRKIGCPQKFTNIIRSFHDGMVGRVLDCGETSAPFPVTHGTKQGCVLAPLLFSIFFSMMLLVAFKDCNLGVPIQFRTDGSVFNLRRLQARTKVHAAIIRDLLFADDCALTAHSQVEAQQLFDRFAAAARRFGLTVSLKKTEVMLQPADRRAHTAPTVRAGDTTLQAVDKFCYLGSVLSSVANIDDDVNARLAKASAAFGRLSKSLWNNHGIRLATKIGVYRAVVLTTLLYGCESWTLHRRHIAKLDQFHLRCLRKIAHIRWQDMIPNTEVLERCDIWGIEAYLMAAQLRWTGHVIRMDDNRIPKMTFYSQLTNGTRSCGGQFKRYKDALKANLKACSIPADELESRASNRDSWRAECKESVGRFEANRIELLKGKRQQRKEQHSQPAATSDFQCDVCGRICGSRIGLFAHRRTHQ